MIELEINQRKVVVAESTTIIEAADEIGIYIPRFCYHKKLSIAANCRMCLVEVEKVGKPLPACATPVTPGMKVLTSSDKALSAQRAVMEYLLINHPLDCPICDQGGECELQDLAMGYGRADSYYREGKRAVKSEDIGPLIKTEMTRCIQCTRCVRFGEEIAGLRELGVIYRGEQEEIATYVSHFLKSELSANIIDICPVGALTDKPVRYQGRGWEYREHPSIGAHDCVGAHTFIHTRGAEYIPQRKVMRAVPRENEAINETWMSDRDRFGHLGLYHASRVYQPRMKQGDRWIFVSWETALQAIADRLQSVLQRVGGGQVAALASSNATVEELYLLQKWMRAIGSANVDHRVRWQDFSDQQHMQMFPHLGMAIADIAHLNAVLLVGSDVRLEQPLISHRLHQASEEASMMAINPVDYSYLFPLAHKMIVPPQHMTMALDEVARALADSMNQSVDELANIQPRARAKAMAQTLKTAQSSALFFGEHALHHPEAACLRALGQYIHQWSTASLGFLTEGTNSAGAWLAGALSHRGAAGISVSQPGLDAKAVLTTQPLSAYFLLNLEPELDCAYPFAALQTLHQAELVVCLSTFNSAEAEQYANFILPIVPYTETDGTWVNVEGVWQSFVAVSAPQGEAQPAWKVLRALARTLMLPGFDYHTAQDIRHYLKTQVERSSASSVEAIAALRSFHVKPSKAKWMRLAPWPIYRVDSLVRRSEPLSQVFNGQPSIGLNAAMAKQWQFSPGDRVTAIQGGSRVTLPVIIDERLADYAVWIPSGLAQTAGFGQAEADIIFERA